MLYYDVLGGFTGKCKSKKANLNQENLIHVFCYKGVRMVITDDSDFDFSQGVFHQELWCLGKSQSNFPYSQKRR